jgi:hypothetical protein
MAKEDRSDRLDEHCHFGAILSQALQPLTADQSPIQQPHPMSIFRLPAHHVRHDLRFRRFALPLLACSLATPVFGQTSWEGDVSNSWQVAGNWSNGVPTLSTDATFPSTTGTTTISFIDSPVTGTWDVQNILFTGGDDYTIGGAHALYAYGDTFDVDGGTQAFNLVGSFRIATGGDYNIINDGTLTFSHQVMFQRRSGSGDATIILSGSGNTSLPNFSRRDTAYDASVIKTGSGTLTLTSGNSNSAAGTPGAFITGTFTINEGTVLINSTPAGASGTGAGAVTVNGATGINKGTLGGSGGTISGATTINANATLAPGTSAGTAGLLTFGNTLSLSNADSKVTFDIATGVRGVAYDAVNVTGQLTYGGDFILAVAAPLTNGVYDLLALTGTPTGNFDTVAFSGPAYNGSFTTGGGGVWTATQGAQTLSFDQSSGDLTVVPEPSTGMMLISALGFGLLLRRRSRAA